MSLIQRNVIPILVLLAVIGVGLTILAVTSPFASGQEADTCEPGVGISIATTNAEGQTVAVVNHGDEIFYAVRLFKDAELCDFGGGTLTVTLPGATEEYPDGTVEISLTETDEDGNETDRVVVSTGEAYNSGQISYVINQNDGIQANADDPGSVELTVAAEYSGGHSLDSSGNQTTNQVGSTATSIIRIGEPSVEIAIYPSDDPDGDDTQSVLQGQTAYFDVVITNTGGFELSDISVASLEDLDAGEMQVADCERASSAFDPLAVGESTTAYQCGTTTEETFVLRAQVTASGTAQDSEGNAVSLEVTNDDTTTVVFGTVDVEIDIVALQDPVRFVDDPEAAEGSFTITATTPEASDLENVTITVTVTGPAADAEAVAADDCFREFATVAADSASKPAELGADGYGCSAKMNEGLNTIEATIEGTIPGTSVVLTATASTTVEAISPGLTINLAPQDQTIRSGETAAITVTVTNGSSELTGVTVVDPDPNNEDGLALSDCITGPDNDPIALGAIGDLSANEQIVINCFTEALTEETGYEAVAIGTARDNTTEPSNTSTAIVRILSPSTDVGVSLLDGGSSVVQLVVQTVVITETNDGDSDLTDVYVDVDAAGIGPDLTSMRLDRNSPQFVRSHGENANDDDVLNPGETWEWRVVIIGVTGNVVLLESGATGIDVTASGYGTDSLGGSVNPETDADEVETQTLGFSAN